MKILFIKTCVVAVLVAGCSLVNAKEYLPPNMAFKPVLSGNIITINIAEGYYLYQNKILLQKQKKDVEFKFMNKSLQKNFPQFGTYSVYLDKVQLKIAPDVKPPLTIRFQGCSAEGLCYPPQQVTLTSIK